MSDLLRDIASTLGKDLRTMRRWCARGYIPGAYRTKGGHWRIRARYSKEALTKKVLAITHGKTRQRKKEEVRPSLRYLGLGAGYYHGNPHLIPPTPSEVQKRMAMDDALSLEMLWRIENPQDLMHSPIWGEYSALPFGKTGRDAFLRRTVRPEALRITKLSSIERHLILLIIGLWKTEERITATLLASELHIRRRNFYRHPVTKRWKSMARDLICNTAAHDKFLARKCGHGFREEVCLPVSDDEIDERLGWKES